MTLINEKPVVLIGAGGHARVLIDCLLLCGRTILGVVDPNLAQGDRIHGTIVLGADDVVFEYSPEKVVLVNGIGMVEYSCTRKIVGESMRHRGYKFCSVIHPRSIIADHVQLEEGVQIMAGAVVQSGTTIGRDSIINTGVVVDHDCVIGSGSHICPGVTLAGSVTVGNEVMLGCGSTVLPGMGIGSCSVIGAGSLINTNVESNVTFIQQRKATIVTRKDI